MITQLRFQNYKGFQKFDLDGLSKITLIGGKNNIGKSSLLEAIFLFYDYANPGLLFRHLTWHGTRVSIRNSQVLFAPIFYDFDMEQRLSITLWDNHIPNKLDVNYKQVLASPSINVDLSTAITNPPNQLISNSYVFNLHYDIEGTGKEDVSLVIRQNYTNLNIQFDPNPPGKVFPREKQRPTILLPLRVKNDPLEDTTRLEI